MTYQQLVRQYLPRANNRVADFILWEMTPFPCWSPVEELGRLAAICAPVRKRGWYRKLANESKRIHKSLDDACAEGASTSPLRTERT